MGLRAIILAMVLAVCAGVPAQAQSARPGTTFRDCPDVCPEMVVIPPGKFVMGSPPSEPGRDGDEVQHDVVIDYAFAAGQFLVTRRQFAQFVAATGYDAKSDGCYALNGAGLGFERYGIYNWERPGFLQTDDDPAVCVSWHDAQAYVAWLSQKTKRPYRLLSEAEWEYAARAGTAIAHYWGPDDNTVCRFANIADNRIKVRFPAWITTNCSDNFTYTSPVGTFPANAFGLYDMAGNAWQWLQDCYRDNYEGAPVDGSAREFENCSTRLLRGSPWYLNQWTGRAAYRGWSSPIIRDYGFGFRVARAMTAAPASAQAPAATRPVSGPPPRSIGR
jgi:formylglycine-generating enzyme required for sulfatase activity